MLVWLPENIYQLVKNNSEYISIIEELEKVSFDGELSSTVPENTPETWPIYRKLYSFLNSVEKNEYEQITWELNKILFDKLFLEIDNENFSYTDKLLSLKDTLVNIKNKIDSLDDSVIKNLLKINFLQYEILALSENNSFFSADLIAKRQELLSTFDSIKKENVTYDSVIDYFENYFNLYMVNLIKNESLVVKSFNDLQLNFNKFRMDLDLKIDEVKNSSIEHNYFKLFDVLNYLKLYFINFYYESFIPMVNLTDDEKLIIDKNIVKYAKSVDFKYKNFNIITLHFYWIRMKMFFSFKDYDQFLKVFNEMCLYLKLNLDNNKKDVIKSIIFHTQSDHIDFLILIKVLLELDEEMSKFFKQEKQLENLNLSEKDITLINANNDNYKNSSYFFDINFIKNRFYG
jgi:hypothetical protein